MASLKSFKLTSISVFLPCYNEERNLKPLVKSLSKVLPECAKAYEIIIIDDGSTDGTSKLADELASKSHHLRVIHHPKNLGYGATLRSGFQAAKYDWTFFTDSDQQFDVSELKSFIPYAVDFPIIIGFRIKRAEGGLRSFNAWLFKQYINLLFRLHVKDIDCAFKLIKTDLIHQINFISTGATINSELLYRLKKMHLPLKQLPVSHLKRQYGKPTGNNLKVVINAGVESVKLYLYMKFGWKFA